MEQADWEVSIFPGKVRDKVIYRPYRWVTETEESRKDWNGRGRGGGVGGEGECGTGEGWRMESFYVSWSLRLNLEVVQAPCPQTPVAGGYRVG